MTDLSQHFTTCKLLRYTLPVMGMMLLSSAYAIVDGLFVSNLVGKTAFALNILRNAAVDHHRPVAIFSLEMSALQLVMRLMTSESGISADKLKGGARLEEYEWKQLEMRLAELSKAPLYIDDTPSIPLMEFRTKVERLVKQ